jgi:hypothetical protein
MNQIKDLLVRVWMPMIERLGAGFKWFNLFQEKGVE